MVCFLMIFLINIILKLKFKKKISAKYDKNKKLKTINSNINKETKKSNL